MIPHNTHHLLYLQTLQANTHKTTCCFSTYNMVLPFPIKKVLIYYFEQHNQSYSQRLKLAKRLLAIHKLVPLYISDKAVLFPIKHQRAPLQTYINALNIIGLTSNKDGVIITFDNNVQLRVDEPYTLIYKKWQESTLLFHLMQKTMQIY